MNLSNNAISTRLGQKTQVQCPVWSPARPKLDPGLLTAQLIRPPRALAKATLVEAHAAFAQLVCTDACGIKWVDDSKATNVESTYTGLMGLKEHKSVVLLGGLAKILSDQASNGFERLVELLEGHRGVITFGSSGAMIHKTLCEGGLGIPCINTTNLQEAVNCARTIARTGDIILLSPGCASFDEFRNFEHRGKVFQEYALSA